MLLSTSKQKFALRKNQENLKVIYEQYWKHETYLHGNEIRKRFTYTTKEIMEKYFIDSQQELTYLLMEYAKDYAGTCIFCKNDYFNYEIRSGERSTYCGCKGICKECNQPSSYFPQASPQVCSSCHWRKEHIEIKNKENEKDNLNFIAFHADAQGLTFYAGCEDVENVIAVMKKRIKFLQSYLKIREIE